MADAEPPVRRSWPVNGGKAGALIRARNWATTPLGPLDGWPQSLKTVVDLILRAPVAMMISWGPGGVCFYNDAFIGIAGAHHPGLLGSAMEAWPEMAALTAKAFRLGRAGKSLSLRDHELKISRGRAEPAWVDLDYTPIVNEAGRFAGVLAIVAETTRRQAADPTLRHTALGEGDGRFREFAENSANVLWIADGATGALEYLSPAFETIWGEPRDAVMRDIRRWTEIVHPDDRATVLTASPRALAGEAVTVEYRIIRPADGETRWIRDSGFPIPAEAGRPRWVGGIAQDITDLKTIEAALRAGAVRLYESEKRLNAALTAARMAAWDWDPDHDRLAVSDTMAEIVGVPPGERLDNSLKGLSYIHSDDLARHRSIVERAGARLESYRSEFRIVRPIDGRIAWIEERAMVRRDPNTGRIRWNGLIWDVTDRKQAEREREAVRLALAEELAAMTRLHDLATRLTGRSELQPLLEEVLEATIELQGADFGDIWLYHAETATIRAVAQRGFTHPFAAGSAVLAFGRTDTACGRALSSGRRVIIEDVEADPGYGHNRRTAAEAGYRALQSTPLFGRAGEPVGVLSTYFRRPHRPSERDLRLTDLYAGQVADAIASQAAQEALRESERRQRALIEGIPLLVWRAADTGEWTWSSPQWSAYTGLSEEASMGRGWLDALHPDDRDRAIARWVEAEKTDVFQADYRIRHAQEDRYRWFQSRAAPVHGEQGTTVEWLGTSTDIDDLRRLQDRQQVLVAELQHRTRNLLAVVRSLAEKTLAGSSSLDDFGERFHDRLSALARVQSLLSRRVEGAKVTFDELLHAELSALGVIFADRVGDQVELDGPRGVTLRSRVVQTFALALHELATNAVKYGALSTPRGHLLVRWWVDSASVKALPRLHVYWRESGVALPSGTSRPSGYGRELIERALPYQLGAETRFELGADGVRCVITMPVSANRFADAAERA